MAEDNENKAEGLVREGTLRKRCPFLQQETWCIGDACALYVEFGQTMGTMQRKVGMCVFVGTNVILSEMNIRLQQQGEPSMPFIQIPGIRGGN